MTKGTRTRLPVMRRRPDLPQTGGAIPSPVCPMSCDAALQPRPSLPVPHQPLKARLIVSRLDPWRKSVPRCRRLTETVPAMPAFVRTGVLTDVPLAELRPNTFQPRMHFARRPLEELARSLADEGQIEPVIARRVFIDGVETLELVAGARRLEAARICDATIRPFPTLRTEIRDLTDEEAERLSLIENLQRENLTPLEEGYRYTHLQRRDPSRWSVRAIADFVHKKKSTIQNRLNLVRDLAVAEAVLSERIPPTAGFHIMRLPPEMRATYLAEAVRHGLTVEQVRADVDRRITILRATSKGIETGDLSGTQPEPDAHATSPTTLLPADADATPTSRTVRLRHLRAQRAQVGLRIDELEAELRRHVVAFRELSVEIAKVDGFHD
ncbi:MAG: ParB/RepB/Spo0J family partition protein [Proteobacteria bacterium]|nr:ParB/RepB/Spo0J family partition protein [Pseudomonadota bacterium]